VRDLQASGDDCRRHHWASAVLLLLDWNATRRGGGGAGGAFELERGSLGIVLARGRRCPWRCRDESVASGLLVEPIDPPRARAFSSLATPDGHPGRCSWPDHKRAAAPSRSSARSSALSGNGLW